MTKLDSLITGGREAWETFYAEKVSHAISDLERFNRALAEYGPWPMYEAIIIASVKKIETDPLNYILTVAHSKWKEQEYSTEEDARYALRVEQAKLQSQEFNEELARKIEKARRRNASSTL